MRYMPKQSPPVMRNGSAPDVAWPGSAAREITVRTVDGRGVPLALAVYGGLRTLRNTCPVATPDGVCVSLGGGGA